MIDLMGLAVITHFDISSHEKLYRYAYDYTQKEYNVSKYYETAPKLSLKGYIPITENLHVDFKGSTGTYTPAVNITGNGSLGLTYKTKTTSKWYIISSISVNRTADIKHKPCTHGDKYNREFTCGYGGIIMPFSISKDTKGQWQSPTINIKMIKRF